MTTKIADHNASSSMDRTCIRWSDNNGKSPDSASQAHNTAPKRRNTDKRRIPEGAAQRGMVG